MIKAYLPKFFFYHTSNSLIRLGKKNDGGYLVSKNDIDKSDLLLSLGIYDDWSFENDFYNLKKIPIKAYDASISKEFFKKRLLRSLFKLNKIKNITKHFKLYYSYINFFKDKKKHICKFVGMETLNKKFCSLKKIIENEKNKNNIFFKIDIEGSEYRILNDLIHFRKKISGIVIEFHNCDFHIDIIKNFIKKIKLNLVHIHANNFSEIRKKDLFPTTLELTFSKYSKKFSKSIFPHKLDMPNNPNSDDIELNFYK